jgi:isoquinoline 1-oxidoreductase subunit alpha
MLLTINGRTYTVADEPNRELLWVLRDELDLKGTRFGCTVGLCGTCLVLLDGKATRSCCLYLSAIGDRPIWTKEGLAEAKARGELPGAAAGSNAQPAGHTGPDKA